MDALTDEDITRAVADDPDAAPLDIDWSKAVIARVIPNTSVSIGSIPIFWPSSNQRAKATRPGSMPCFGTT